MMGRHFLADRAANELRNQYEYLLEAADDAGPALRLAESFERNASMYAGNPDLGSRDVASSPELRAFLFGTPTNPRGWIAFYRPVGDGIEIARVFRGSQDFLAEL